VIHSYRFDFGLARGDPTLPDLEERLAQKPLMEVPAITIDGPQDPLKPKGNPQVFDSLSIVTCRCSLFVLYCDCPEKKVNPQVDSALSTTSNPNRTNHH
jgi:hypothetical protein